jgi:hypothetical protein
MAKVIKLTESDIERIVGESLSEIGWQTPNDLYDKHYKGAYYLSLFAHDLRNFIEKWDNEDYMEERDNNSIKNVSEPLRGRVLQFLEQAKEMADYCERKSEQIKGFEKTADSKFQQQYGKSMEDYADEYSDERDALFDKYAKGDMPSDEYDAADQELRGRYPEMKNITRY